MTKILIFTLKRGIFSNEKVVERGESLEDFSPQPPFISKSKNLFAIII